MTDVPNLFVVGAPKCGSTALWTYLGEHPDIFMGGKEYHYFGSDLAYHGPRSRLTSEAYLRCFAAANGERYRGEASVGYLYSTRAAQEIHAYSSDARIIAILRNPVDMIHALHSEELFQGDEDIADFEAALAAEEGRRQGEGIPATCEALWPLFYRDVGRYASQVRRYIDVFGRDRVHVIISEEFRADTSAGYQSVLEFLGVDPEFQPEFPVVNANKVPRSTTAVRLLRRPPRVVHRLARLLMPDPATRRAMGKRLQELNVDQRPRTAMAPELRRSLQAEYADDVARLGRLLGRDLSLWTDSPA
jgi:hypothetical protein